MKAASNDVLDVLLALFFDSPNVELLAQRLVHDETLIPGQPTGVFLFSVTAQSELKFLGGFGDSKLSSMPKVSIWDEHPISAAVRQRGVVKHKATPAFDENCLCLPLIRGKVPNGAIAIQYKQLPSDDEDSSALSTLISMGGYFLALQGLSIGKVSLATGESPVMPEELSTRQLEILKLIGDGLNNADIAQRVLVSESTVRQETIKIYRILQVSNRHEAMMKGRALELISSPVALPPPPPRNI